MKSNHPCRRAVCLLAAFCLLATLPACRSGQSDTPETAAPVEEVTLPSLADDRTPTATAGYEERLTAAFQNKAPTPAEQFTYTATDDGVTVTAYTGGDVVVVIPEEIEGKPVVAIAEGAFAGKGTLRALSIPDSVSEPAFGALSGCASLATLRTPLAAASGSTHFGSLFGAESHETNATHVPATLSTLILTGGETVPAYAFYDCNIEAVSLPATVTEIGEFAFYGNETLAYIPLGKTALTSVGEHAFAGCASLLSLELPATVTAMGFAMLEGCGELESLTLPFVGASRGIANTPEVQEEAETDDADALSTDHIGYLFGARAYVHSAGYIPASLITVTLLEGCGDIPANAFFECSSIREVVLPAGVTAIGRRAFYGCAKLSGMTLPDSVTSLGDDSFHGCIRLVDLRVGTGLGTLGVQIFMDCLSLESVSLPPSVTYLPNATFAGCISLKTVTAPGVVSQGEKVFHNCEKLTGWAQSTVKP